MLPTPCWNLGGSVTASARNRFRLRLSSRFTHAPERLRLCLGTERVMSRVTRYRLSTLSLGHAHCGSRVVLPCPTGPQFPLVQAICGDAAVAVRIRSAGRGRAHDGRPDLPDPLRHPGTSGTAIRDDHQDRLRTADRAGQRRRRAGTFMFGKPRPLQRWSTQSGAGRAATGSAAAGASAGRRGRTGPLPAHPGRRSTRPRAVGAPAAWPARTLGLPAAAAGWW